MKSVVGTELQTQIERLLTKYDSLTRPDLALELRAYEESAISAALEALRAANRILVQEDEKGVKVYKKVPGFFRSVGIYSTNTGY